MNTDSTQVDIFILYVESNLILDLTLREHHYTELLDQVNVIKGSRTLIKNIMNIYLTVSTVDKIERLLSVIYSALSMP